MDPLRSSRLRSSLWRLGRKLYQYARREGANHPAHNGEYWLLDAVLRRLHHPRMTLLDVGANLGDWTCEALRGLARYGHAGQVHAFEPTSSSFEHLEGRFAEWRSGDTPRVVLRRLALSERSGTRPLYVVGAHAGTNSLVDMRIGAPSPVPVSTVDDYLREHDIEHVAFLKSDTEGHDAAVLRGGLRALAEGRIDAWQFEYNARWIYDRAFLRDVFELLRGAPYLLGRLSRGGVEVYHAWHPELERYFETNFVLLRAGSPLEGLGHPVRFDRRNVPVPARRG